MIELSYNEKEDIILVDRTGEICVQDLIGYIRKIDQDYRKLERLYILDDTSGSVSKFNHRDDYTLLVNELKKHLGNYIRVYVGIVSDTPHNTALSDIYKVITEKINNYFFRVFSSREAAGSWLKMCV